jgi:hypothetical protein
MDSLIASNQFKDEVNGVVKRYAIESDLSVFLMIGALEVVKQQLLRQLEESGKNES